jgi:Uma2 family endonuclease
MVTHLIALGATFDHLPDDTEETLLGSSLHQGAIVALATGLTLCGPHRGLPWFIGNQIKVIVPREGRRASYMPSPDILVHPTLTNASRTSLVLATDGPPALVIEVASPSTVLSSDLNLTDARGKPGVYEAIGVAEYIVFDPTTELVREQVWARRRVAGAYAPWEPDKRGRWVSAALGGIAFAPQGPLLRVYDQEGHLVPLTEEMADLLGERERQLTAQEQQLSERERQLSDRERQIAALEAELRRLRGDEPA